MFFRDFGGNDFRLRPFTVKVQLPAPAYGQREKRKIYFEYVLTDIQVCGRNRLKKNKMKAFTLLMNQDQINNCLISTHKYPPSDHACYDLQLYNAEPTPHLDDLQLRNVHHDGSDLVEIVTHEGLGHR